MRRAFSLVFLLATCAASCRAQQASPDDSLWIAPALRQQVIAVGDSGMAAWCIPTFDYRRNMARLVTGFEASTPFAPVCSTPAVLVRRPTCWFHAVEIMHWFLERRYALVAAICDGRFLVLHWPTVDRGRIS